MPRKSFRQHLPRQPAIATTKYIIKNVLLWFSGCCKSFLHHLLALLLVRCCQVFTPSSRSLTWKYSPYSFFNCKPIYKYIVKIIFQRNQFLLILKDIHIWRILGTYYSYTRFDNETLHLVNIINQNTYKIFENICSNSLYKTTRHELLINIWVCSFTYFSPDTLECV